MHLSGLRSPYPGIVARVTKSNHSNLLRIDVNPLENNSTLKDHDKARELTMIASAI